MIVGGGENRALLTTSHFGSQAKSLLGLRMDQQSKTLLVAARHAYVNNFMDSVEEELSSMIDRGWAENGSVLRRTTRLGHKATHRTYNILNSVSVIYCRSINKLQI